MASVGKALRERIASQARSRCGYCLMAEAIVGIPMEIEHFIPEALGGPIMNGVAPERGTSRAGDVALQAGRRIVASSQQRLPFAHDRAVPHIVRHRHYRSAATRRRDER